MRSASAPRRPMTMPGRAVWMSTRTRSRVRSISTFAMPARSMPLDMSLRIATSSLTYSAYCLSANQRLFKSVVMPEAEAVRVDLLTHYWLRPFSLLGVSMLSTSMVMWLVRLRMRYARPCARGRNRLSVGPSST